MSASDRSMKFSREEFWVDVFAHIGLLDALGNLSTCTKGKIIFELLQSVEFETDVR